LVLPLLWGCGQKIPEPALTALGKGEKFELFSLSPEHFTEDKRPPNHFHGWEVLGSTKVEKADVRKQLVAALKKAAAENDGVAAACFNPRHGIRVVQEDKTIDLVICFECYSTTVYVDDVRKDSFLLTDSAKAAFDKVLQNAKVPLPKKDE
jgi:hypothetical protein